MFTFKTSNQLQYPKYPKSSRSYGIWEATVFLSGPRWWLFVLSYLAPTHGLFNAISVLWVRRAASENHWH